MVAKVMTMALRGLEATPVDVQVQIASGLPAFNVVGLPSKAVKEATERVRASFHAMGLAIPPERVTVNLAPADLAKDGSHYDLPIALGLLVVMGVLPADSADGWCVMGELGLDGVTQPVPGCLPAAVGAAAAGCRMMLVPELNAPEAAWATNEGGMGVLGIKSLRDLIRHVRGEELLLPVSPKAPQGEIAGPGAGLDMRDIRGQESAKRAAEIAAAGGHHLLMSGPPGSGKSMLAARLPALLPPLTPGEALEVSMIHSVAGVLGAESSSGLVVKRPLRDPHHSASPVALTGGGLKARPGEMSLAHRGVLFLDELPEFPRAVLETLRQPLETGSITIARANNHVTYPARFMLVAAMNPCTCGYLGDPVRGCKTPKCAEAYQARLSGPLLDRFDVRIQVPAVKPSDLSLPPAKDGTAEMAGRVRAARAIQAKRFEGTVMVCNAEMHGRALDDFCPLDTECRALLNTAAEKLGLTARGYHRIMRVARTIADLAQAPDILRPHLAEALAYRGFSA